MMAALFAACEGNDPMRLRDMALLRLLYSAALRRAEACSLDVAHVDFDRRVLSVLRKGRTVRVDVAMAPKLESALRAWLAVRGTDGAELLVNFDPTGKGGRRLTGDGVAAVLRAIGKRAGAWGLDADAPEATRGFLLNHLIAELLPEQSSGYRYSNSDPVTGQAAWYDLRVRVEKAADQSGESAPQFPSLKNVGVKA